MTCFWKKMMARFDALQVRERWLVAVALIGGIVLCGYTLFVEPHLQRERMTERNIAGERARLTEMEAQMRVLGAADRHPDVAARKELAELRAKLGALSDRLRALENALVPPDRMTALLEEMIGVKSGLRLVSLKTLPPMPFMGAGEEEKKGEKDGKAGEKTGGAGGTGGAGNANGVGAKSAGLYRHGVEIRLEGRYRDICAYLERLEKSPVKFLWGAAALSAENHPHLVFTLTVYSLSMDRTWLIV